MGQCLTNKLVATKPSACLLGQAVSKSRTCQNLVGNKVKFNFTTGHWISTRSETYGLPGHHSGRLNTAYMLCLHCLINLYLCVDGYVSVINGPVSWGHIIFERLTRIMGDNAWWIKFRQKWVHSSNHVPCTNHRKQQNVLPRSKFQPNDHMSTMLSFPVVCHRKGVSSLSIRIILCRLICT